MATTTNYGWETPDDTDLVKDGASAIRTLGSSIDTTTKALNPSTTLGDIEYRSSTANTNTRLGIGTTGQVLTVSAGGVPSWATSSSGGMTSLATGTLSGVEVSITSISQDYIDLYLVITSFRTSSANKLGLRINNNTGSNYEASWTKATDTSIFSSGSTTALDLLPANMYTSDYDDSCFVKISNYKSADSHTISGSYSLLYAGYGGNGSYYVNLNGAITSLQIRNLNGTSTFGGGTYTLYGVK